MSVRYERQLASEQATERLGAEIALWLRPGDLVALEGPIGAGKSVLARAIVAGLVRDGEAVPDVPSPTFTLVQSYPRLRVPVAHVDLYRIESVGELDELGIEEALDEGAVIVEWPDRMNGLLPADRLAVALSEAGEDARLATLVGHGSWAARLARGVALGRFLDDAGWGAARRQWLKGDASTRSYERLADVGRSAVVMNAPRGGDGPPVRDGRAYSRIAHLAEDVGAFVAIDGYLRGLGLSAPEILARDLDQGFLVLEDLGDELFGRLVERAGDLAEPYAAAIEALARLHGETAPVELPVDGARTHLIPRYGEEVYLIEAELLLDWTWPAVYGVACPEDRREAYRAIWRDLLAAVEEPRVLVLRDFHSPNLLWLPDRQGAGRAGLIDFQDALIGHPAYDLVSLAEDARVDLPSGMREHLIARYLAGRPAGLVEEAALRTAMAVLGAQRAAKIVGIFTRLAHRDGKTAYLAHIPRVVRHLEANLAHPALAPLRRWFAAHDGLLRQTADRLAGAA